MKYSVIVTETLSQKVNVVADSEYEALELVEKSYYNSDIILDCDDFVSVGFDIDEERN